MSIVQRLLHATEYMRQRVAPDLRYSQAYYEDELRRLAQELGAWLDVGCGHQVLPAWRRAYEVELVSSVPLVVGIDPDADSLAKHATLKRLVCGDVRRLPFPDGTFDLVTANMVVEHLPDPELQFAEISRVLRQDGVFLFHTPNARSYPSVVARIIPSWCKLKLARVLDGREEGDVFPTFYRANTKRAIVTAAASAGLVLDKLTYTPTLPIFSVIPPLALAELVYYAAFLRTGYGEPHRQTIICMLRKRVE